MPLVNQQIVGFGGGGRSDEETRVLLRHAVGLTGRERPRILFVPTAVGDATEEIARDLANHRRRRGTAPTPAPGDPLIDA
jgi:hypothetical protein